MRDSDSIEISVIDGSLLQHELINFFSKFGTIMDVDMLKSSCFLRFKSRDEAEFACMVADRKLKSSIVRVKQIMPLNQLTKSKPNFGSQLKIQNISWSVSEVNLKALLLQFGPISSLKLFKHGRDSSSQAYIHFENVDSSQKAQSSLQGTDFMGSRLFL